MRNVPECTAQSSGIPRNTARRPRRTWSDGYMIDGRSPPESFQGSFHRTKSGETPVGGAAFVSGMSKKLVLSGDSIVQAKFNTNCSGKTNFMLGLGADGKDRTSSQFLDAGAFDGMIGLLQFAKKEREG